MGKIIIGVFLVFLAAGAIFFASQNKSINKTQDSSGLQKTGQKDEKNATGFSTPKKSAHYESNTPEHGSIIPEVPINVVINFNFDLAKPSEIKIEKDGKDYGVGETVIDENKLSMRKNMDSASPDGIYKVEYNACWPDKSCHDGNFEFEIRRGLDSSYEDLRKQKEVTINLSKISFKPKEVLIARGTKVTWINDDDVEHYVNTDSHPAHTYFVKQNSKSLKKGDSYSLSFDQPGFYPYHCSAHADSMKGAILVE